MGRIDESIISKYSHMLMQCFVGATEVNCGIIGPSDLNYGQHWRWKDQQRCEYRLTLPIDEFCQKVARGFEEFCREVAEDMAEHASAWAEPMFTQLRELRFPPLSVMIRDHPGLLSEALRWDEGFNLLHWLGMG